MVKDGAFLHKIDYFTILNCGGYLSCITGSRVTAILLNAWILPNWASTGEGLQSTGLPRLVYIVAQEITKVQGLSTIYDAYVV